MQTTIANLSVWEESPQQATTLLFLHGHCTNKRFFAKQMNAPELQSFHRVAIDLPGYGSSKPPVDPHHTYNFPGFAEAVLAVLDQLTIKKLIIIGWSLGGHLALELAESLPQLAGILITGTPPIPLSIEGLQKGFIPFDPTIMACFGKRDLTLAEAKQFAKISGYDGTPEKDYLVDSILATDPDARSIYPQSISKGIGKNQCEVVARLAKPIAVVAGADDPAINYDYVQNEVVFKNLWQNKIHVIENAGHPVPIEQPDEFNQLISEFIKHALIMDRELEESLNKTDEDNNEAGISLRP